MKKLLSILCIALLLCVALPVAASAQSGMMEVYCSCSFQGPCLDPDSVMDPCTGQCIPQDMFPWSNSVETCAILIGGEGSPGTPGAYWMAYISFLAVMYYYAMQSIVECLNRNPGYPEACGFGQVGP